MDMLNNLTIILLLFVVLSCQQINSSPRETTDFNFDWKFHLNDVEHGQELKFDDSGWNLVQLPHDWSVEHAFTQDDAAGATAFLPGGVGWYRKNFTLPKNSNDKLTRIEFDGVYSNSEVWINNHYLGKRPYGYIPFSYDLTPYLKYGADKNVIEVRVDRSAYLDCRWYPGSGIYRNVKLVRCAKVNIPQWGVFISTPIVTTENAEVEAIIQIQNRSSEFQNVKVLSEFYFENKKVGQTESIIKLDASELKEVKQNLQLVNPMLWSIDAPNIYLAKHLVYANNVLVDEYKTKFGVRSFNFDRENGFFLNGKNVLLKGVCLHHDGGLVGAAVPKDVWQRRLKTLKDIGCNAIRTAHNPPSEEFLDLCDEMGFLVQDEAFDEWNNPKDKRNNYNQQKAEKVTKGYTEHFSEWAERDLKAMIQRDQNHPSIIMWSIGNEIEWTYPRYAAAPGYWGANKVGDVNYYWDEPPLNMDQIKQNFESTEKQEYDLVATAQKLAKWVREVDTTRPVTANLVIPSVSNFSGYAEALDIVGLSYRQAVYDYCYENYPDMIFLGTENWTQWSEWQPVLEKKFISGIFLWTGINYMGESRSWPVRGSGSGLLDFAGFEKPSGHFFRTLWNEAPHVYITTQKLDKSPYIFDNESGLVVEKTDNWAKRKKWGWQNVNEHWNYNNGDSIAVEVYTNQNDIELFINDQSLGVRKLSDNNDRILKWLVPFSSGVLEARTLIGNAIYSTKIETAGNLAKLNMTVDKNVLIANAYDVAHIVVQLCDENGNPIKHIDEEVEFDVTGNAKILGVDNGSPSNIQDYQSNKITTSNGRCLLIVQSTHKSGKINIQAQSKDFISDNLEILVKRKP